MTREETAQLLAMMKAVWPNHPMPEPDAMVMAYWMGLDDVSADVVAIAFKAHLKDPQRGRFFPTVADLRAGLPTMPMRNALPAGTQAAQPTRHIFRVFDSDADDYVDLPVPIPDTSDEYAEAMAASREALREAGRPDRERKTEAA